MIKVSVITPIYNRRNLVKRLLNNLKSQTLKEIEFIIIDDGSTDNTYEYLRNKTQQDERFCIIKTSPNQGPYSARNIGLKNAQGEYIGFFDSDDNIPTNYFQSLYEQAQGADIIYTSYNNIPHYTKQIKGLKDKFNVLKNGAIWDKLYKKEYLQKNNITFTEGLYTADNLFIIETFIKTNNIKLTETPNYEYILQKDSISTDQIKEDKRKKDIIQILKKAIKTEKENNLSFEEKDCFRQFLIRSLYAYPKDKKFRKQFYQILGKKNKETTLKLRLLKILKKLHLINKKQYKKLEELELIKSSPLFDAVWYIKQNRNIKHKRYAALHYTRIGWKVGKNPSKYFDGSQYLKDYSDVSEQCICPLVHYLKYGQEEGRSYKAIRTEIKR